MTSNPAFVTSENVKFKGTSENAVVLKDAAGIKSLILWDDLSAADQQLLIDFVAAYGGTTPLAGPVAGNQTVNYNAAKIGSSSTGLSNVAAATAGVATIDVGGDKVGGGASGLSTYVGSAGYQVANFAPGVVGTDSTNLLSTNGYQEASFTIAKVGGDSTGLADDTAGYQIVDVGGAKTLASATGLTDDVPATSGYQDVIFGVAKAGGDATGLTNDATVYTASIAVDGTPTPIDVTGSAAQTFTDLLNEINTDLGVTAVASIVAGNIRVTSASTGVTSTIAITDTNLFSTLTDYSSIALAVGGTDVVVTTYTASISIDGGAHVRAVSIDGGNAQTYADLISELDSDSGSWYAASLVGGNLAITSLQPGAVSDIAITDTDLFSSLTDYVAINAGVPGTHTDYTATISIDGEAGLPISVSGAAAQTFTTLLDEINTDLGVDAVISIVAGNLRVTSATFGPTSTVAITDVDLFSTLTDFDAVETAVDGVNSNVALTATIAVDGADVPVSILPSSIATFADVINEINADLGVAATAAIVGGDIKITSATLGSTSSVLIDGGTLFPALPNFNYTFPAVDGKNTSKTYSATVEVDGVLKSVNFSGVAGATFQDVLDEINTDLGVTATASLSGGNVIITSASTGLASKVKVYDTGFLFSSLTDYAGISTVDGVAPRTYTATITVDGVAKDISVVGNAAQTFTTLVNEINTDLGASATAALSPVATSGSQTALFDAVKVGGDATGLANDATAYTATITVDGVAKAISVVGSAAQTFTTLLDEVNTDLGASATIAIASGNLKVTSATTGLTSTVSIVDVDLFSSLTDFLSLDLAVTGTASNIVVTSATTGLTSTVSIADVDLFKSVAGYVGTAVPQNGATDLLAVFKTKKVPNGSSYFEQFDVKAVGAKPAVPPYCPHSVDFIYHDGLVWRYLDNDAAV